MAKVNFAAATEAVRAAEIAADELFEIWVQVSDCNLGIRDAGGVPDYEEEIFLARALEAARATVQTAHERRAGLR